MEMVMVMIVVVEVVEIGLVWYADNGSGDGGNEEYGSSGSVYHVEYIIFGFLVLFIGISGP